MGVVRLHEVKGTKGDVGEFFAKGGGGSPIVAGGCAIGDEFGEGFADFGGDEAEGFEGGGFMPAHVVDPLVMAKGDDGVGCEHVWFSLKSKRGIGGSVAG